MKLSKQLEEDHLSGDFGRALEGYSERAEELEEALEWVLVDYCSVVREEYPPCANAERRITKALKALDNTPPTFDEWAFEQCVTNDRTIKGIKDATGTNIDWKVVETGELFSATQTI